MSAWPRSGVAASALFVLAAALTLAALAPVAPAFSASEIVPANRDVNGDGLDDVAIQRFVWDGDAGDYAGGSIVFGRREGGSLDIQQPGPGHLWTPERRCSLVIAGDVNGDGRSDMLAGCDSASAFGRRASGVVTVLFGGAGGGVMNLRDPGGNGFRILGAARGRHLGTWVAPAGDVNGDGLADVLLGTLPKRPRRAPWAYLVLGRRAVADDIDLAATPRSVIRVQLPKHSSAFYFQEATGTGVGDVDGDGFGDMAFGDRPYPESSCGEETCAGRAWLVYGGRALPRRISLLRLGSRGYVIRSARRVFLADLGGRVQGAGDLNGDGRAEVLVDALYASGTVPFVIWGGPRPRARRAHALSTRTARLGGGECCSDGTHAVPLGDVDGDGRADLMAVVAPNSRRSIFVVSGRRWTGELDARSERTWVRRATDNFEFAPAGDVNGDGSADLLVRRRTFAGNAFTGRTDLLFARAGTFATALDTPGGDVFELIGADVARGNG